MNFTETIHDYRCTTSCLNNQVHVLSYFSQHAVSVLFLIELLADVILQTRLVGSSESITFFGFKEQINYFSGDNFQRATMYDRKLFLAKYSRVTSNKLIQNNIQNHNKVIRIIFNKDWQLVCDLLQHCDVWNEFVVFIWFFVTDIFTETLLI